MKIISIKDIPIGFFAMTMTLFGLSLAWKLSGLSEHFSTFLTLVAIFVFILVATAYLIKFIKYRSHVMQEFTHPILMSFFGTISVSLVFFSVILAEHLPLLAKLIWISGSACHTLLLFYTLGQWLFHGALNIDNLTPACFIPIVGLAVVPIYGAAYGFAQISWFYWSIALALWIILLVFVFYRLMFVCALPAPLLPTLFILLAPPSIIFVNYINLTGQRLDIFNNVLYSISALFACLLLSQIKKFILPFTMSHWAFTFPVVAFSMATMIMGKLQKSPLLLYAGYGVLCCITVFICIVLVLTLKHVILRKN